MKKFLLAAAVGTAGLLVFLYVQARKKLREEADRFEEICPDPGLDDEAY